MGDHQGDDGEEHNLCGDIQGDGNTETQDTNNRGYIDSGKFAVEF